MFEGLYAKLEAMRKHSRKWKSGKPSRIWYICLLRRHDVFCHCFKFLEIFLIVFCNFLFATGIHNLYLICEIFDFLILNTNRLSSAECLLTHWCTRGGQWIRLESISLLHVFFFIEYLYCAVFWKYVNIFWRHTFGV